MVRIGLISDVHATATPVAEALSIFNDQGVDRIFCCGDTAGYREEVDRTIELLEDAGCKAILGNHDRLYLDHYGDEPGNRAVEYFRQLPAFIDTEIAGKRVYMVHAQPPDACHGGIKLRDRTGEVQPDRVARWAEQLHDFDHDVLVVGHTHQVFAEQVGNTLVVNPGSSAFNYSCAILSLPELSVEFYPLSGREIAMTWKWSDHMTEGATSR